MFNELAALLGRVAELHGRATEISNRVRQDAQLLSAVQHEFSTTLNDIWQQQREAAPPTQVPPPSTGRRVIRLTEVCKRIGLGRSSVWKMMKEGRFPQPIRLGVRAVGWRDAQVDEWLRTREVTNAGEGSRPSRGRRGHRGP